MTSPRPTIIYIGDPMCSWCYGISNEMDYVIKHFEKTTEFKMIMGGLRPYNRESMADLKDFLTHHWKDVYEASGQEFSYGILNEENIVYDTEPPSRANIVVRKLSPSKEWQFFKLVQHAFYNLNADLNKIDSYYSVLKQLDIDPDAFANSFNSLEMKDLVREDFEKSSHLGVRSFPTVLLKKDGKVHTISNGFSKKEVLIERISAILN